MLNLFPQTEGIETSRFKAFWCRWFHSGSRLSSGWPAAGKVLEHSVECTKCGARYIIIQPNTPQYANKMPFQKPDKSAPESWDGYWLAKKDVNGKFIPDAIEDSPK